MHYHQVKILHLFPLNETHAQTCLKKLHLVGTYHHATPNRDQVVISKAKRQLCLGEEWMRII
jgi:hypothetical protein